MVRSASPISDRISIQRGRSESRSIKYKRHTDNYELWLSDFKRRHFGPSDSRRGLRSMSPKWPTHNRPPSLTGASLRSLLRYLIQITTLPLQSSLRKLSLEGHLSFLERASGSRFNLLALSWVKQIRGQEKREKVAALVHVYHY